MSSSVDSALDAAMSKSLLVQSNFVFCAMYSNPNLARTDLSIE